MSKQLPASQWGLSVLTESFKVTAASASSSPTTAAGIMEGDVCSFAVAVGS